MSKMLNLNETRNKDKESETKPVKAQPKSRLLNLIKSQIIQKEPISTLIQ
jgi:hypothetical protein